MANPRKISVDLKKEVAGGKFDAILRKYAPGWAAKRMRSRVAMAATTGYIAADKGRHAIRGWDWATGDADSDILPDLDTLRKEARDLSRNSPVGRAAVSTNVTNVIGTGLIPNPQIDREVLGISDDQADEYERIYKAEFDLWAGTTACDIQRELNFYELQSLIFRSVLDSGDTFILTPSTERPETPYSLRLQLIEADRVSNKDNVADTDLLAGGIQKNKSGETVSFHILNGHPGNYLTDTTSWEVIPAFGSSGRRNVIHVFPKERIGQRRGVPYLAPVMEQIKQLTRYTEAEIMAAVVTSFFTVFVTSLTGEGLDPIEEAGGRTSDKDFRMGQGNILDLAPDESVDFADPSRPNKGYSDFEAAMVRQVGAALEIPYEILSKVFMKSYSASRASMLEAWRYFFCRRHGFVARALNPVRELWFFEAVALGRIPAPGFLSGDPLIRRAYMGARWIGPPRGMIDEVKEIEGSERRVEAGYSTIEEEAAMLTGADSEKVHKQRVKEVTRRRADGLEHDVTQIQEIRR